MTHPADAKPCIGHASKIEDINCATIVQNGIECGFAQLASEIYEPTRRLFTASKLMCYLIIIEIDAVMLGKLSMEIIETGTVI